MMKCKSIERMLSAYAANELNVLHRWIVSQHVGRCEACCAELSAYAKTREKVYEILKNKYQDVSDESIWPQVASRSEMIRNSEKVKETWMVPTLGRRVVPVLAGVFVLIISLWIHHAGQSPPKGILKSTLPLVEDYHEKGLTMMIFETDDPTISIVWFFKEDESNQENTNGGV